jgi:hypothetical protein
VTLEGWPSHLSIAPLTSIGTSAIRLILDGLKDGKIFYRKMDQDELLRTIALADAADAAQNANS